MTPGSSDTATVAAINTGSTTWTPARDYRLGSQVPPDNTYWGTARVDLPVVQVDPQAQAVFNFPITAPTSVGRYTFCWQMVRDPDHFFGSFFSAEMVTVAPVGEAPVVPDVTGLTENDAEQAIVAANLAYKVFPTGLPDHGTVIKQSPAAGTTTTPGAVVSIWVSVRPNQ
jgi:PASTA domain